MSPTPDNRAAAEPDRETDDIDNAVIGALILAAPSVRALMLDTLTDEDLADPRCRFLVGTVRAMVAEGVPVDTLTVAEFINTRALLAPGGPRMGVATTLYRMTNAAPVPVSGPWYAALAVEAAARRRINGAGQELMRVAGAGSLTDLRTITTTEFGAVVNLLDRAERAVSRYVA